MFSPQAGNWPSNDLQQVVGKVQLWVLADYRVKKSLEMMQRLYQYEDILDLERVYHKLYLDDGQENHPLASDNGAK